MDIFAFRVDLKDKNDDEPTTEYGVILSASYPKAANALVVKYRDNYIVDNLYIDSLCSGNIKPLDRTTYDQLVSLFASLPTEEDADETV